MYFTFERLGLLMRNLILTIIKKPFVRNVTMLVTGTAAAQALTLAASPFITRIYGPEAFGILGAFNAIISIVAPIGALTYPIAIVLPKNDQDARGIIRLSLIIAAIIATVLFSTLLIFNNYIVNLFGLHEIAVFLYFIPLVIIFSALMQVSEQWLIRTRQFSINAKVSFIHSLVMNLSKIGIGLFKPLSTVLVLLQAASNGIKALLMIIFSKGLFNSADVQLKDGKKSIKKLAKTHYDFPVFRAPQVLLNGVSMGLPVLMLTTFFGPTSAGFYTLSRTALSAPTQLIGKSVSDVFYPRISEAAHNNENIAEMLIKATLTLFLIGLIPFGLIIFFGPTIFTFVFGEEWTTAGEYARWVALWVYFSFVNRPSVKTLPVLSAQAFHLAFTVVMLLSNATALYIGYYFFLSDTLAVTLVGISGAFFSLAIVIMTIILSKKRVKLHGLNKKL